MRFHRLLTVLTACTAFCAVLAPPLHAAGSKPNILVILADDKY
jgi:hypothetical protein